MGIDFREIIKSLTIEGVKSLLTSLDIPFKENEAALIMPTACHNDDLSAASWKLYFYKNSKSFHCFTQCSESFSIFKFLRKYYDTRLIEYDWYKDILNVVVNCTVDKMLPRVGTRYETIRTDYDLKKNREKLPTYLKGILDCFIKMYPVEWLQDSISREALDKYGIRYSISQNKIIIPHLDVNGELVGIRGRALNEEEIQMFAKYAPVQIEGFWYSHPLSLNLYGLNCAREKIKETGVVFVFEGEKSCLQVEGFDMPNCAVATCGSNFNKFQVDLLMRTCAPREIILCYDNEEKKGQDTYFQKLYETCRKYSPYCKMSFVYDREKILPQQASPSDCGQEKFEKLLKERVQFR